MQEVYMEFFNFFHSFTTDVRRQSTISAYHLVVIIYKLL